MDSFQFKRAYYERLALGIDPLGISGLKIWHPLDKRREVLPTGQEMTAENTSGTATYETYQGIPSMQWAAGTAAPSTEWMGVGAGGYKSGTGVTVSIWYYGNHSSTHNVWQIFRQSAASGTANDKGQYHLYISASYISFREYLTSVNGIMYVAIGELVNGWNNIMVTGTAAGALTLYVNGASKATATATASFAGYIGGRVMIPNYQANCRLAGLRLYDRVLTSTERTKILNEYN